MLLAKKDPNAEANALVLMCTVKGDLHDLGKNMVGAMLRTCGFDVHDMGKDVNADKIIAAIEEMHPKILGMSALLTTTVPYQETVIKKLVAAGMRDRVKVMVGGAPVTPEWADEDRRRRLREQRARGGRDREEAGGRRRMSPVAVTTLSGPGGEVHIGDEHPFAIIGERINPTGRSVLTEEIWAGDMTTVQADAIAQVAAGARILDLNAGMPGFDEPEMLSQVVKAVHEVVGVPLCIDSSTPEALEAAVPLAQGKVLINSVTAEAHSLERLLPLVKRFGAAVIGMANDEEGISMDPRGAPRRRAQDRGGGRRPRHRPRGRHHRSAHDADRRGARRRHLDVRDDAADPR